MNLVPLFKKLVYRIYYAIFPKKSQLEQWISPEIFNDPLYEMLVEVIKRFPITTVLELGASSGEGSTEAIITGVIQSQRDIQVHSLEVSTQRFERLKERHKRIPWFHPYNRSSVALSGFLTPSQIQERTATIPGISASQSQLEQWRDQDVQYIQSNHIPTDGIAYIKATHNIDEFDCVLIDSSAFTGDAEYDQTQNTPVIILDDVVDIKCWNVYLRLKDNAHYSIFNENLKVRNGYAVFIRNDF